MQFTINIEKKHFYLLAAVVFVLEIFTVFAALSFTEPFSSSSPWHPLQQITIDQNGATSVDANSNAIIDNTDKLQGLSASNFCRSNGVNCPGSIWTIYTISGNDVSFNGNVEANSITLGGETRTTWPSDGIWSSGVDIGTCCDGGGSTTCGHFIQSGECSPIGDTNRYVQDIILASCGSGTLKPWYEQTCVANTNGGGGGNPPRGGGGNR